MRKLPGNFEEIPNAAHNYLWPRKGDRPLRASDEWACAVEFTSQPHQKHVLLWDGYLSAADGLVSMCLTEEYKHERDTVIYPILFNYRYGLELAMKWIILNFGGEGLGGMPDDHNLWQLWKRCREIIEETAPSPDRCVDNVIEQVIKDFHELDKSGVNLRYGWSKNGREIKLPEHPIDLANLRDVMEGLTSYFDDLDGWLSHLHSVGP